MHRVCGVGGESRGVAVFLEYMRYKRQCERQAAIVLTYSAWLWVFGLTSKL